MAPYPKRLLGIKPVGKILAIMAFPVVEFSRQGYKIRKVYG
jgi:hypothetical protein